MIPIVDDTVTSMAAVGAFGLSVAMFFHLGSQLKWGKASVCLVSAYLVGWNVLWLPMIWFSGIVALPVIILADMLHRCSKADQWRRHRGEAGPSSQSASSGPRFVFTGAGHERLLAFLLNDAAIRWLSIVPDGIYACDSRRR